MKRWSMLVMPILIVTIVVLISVAKVSTRRPHVGVDAARVASSKIVNGAQSPELIPDHVAYRMLFRLISNRRSENEKRSIQSYLMQAGVTGESDIDALLALAETFHQRASVLDQKNGAIKARYYPNRPDYTLEERELLNQLSQQREVLVAEIVASLPSKLSPTALANLRIHVNERVKRNIKLVAD